MTESLLCRVTPFGNPGIIGCLLLPQAFRSLPRPSSPNSSKASSVDPYSLDHISLCSFLCFCGRRCRVRQRLPLILLPSLRCSTATSSLVAGISGSPLALSADSDVAKPHLHCALALRVSRGPFGSLYNCASAPSGFYNRTLKLPYVAKTTSRFVSPVCFRLSMSKDQFRPEDLHLPGQEKLPYPVISPLLYLEVKGLAFRTKSS